MDEIVTFIEESKVFHIATIDGDQPRVRPFVFIMKFEDRLYFATGNFKPFYRQLQANPRVEISALHPDGRWIRLRGKAVFDGNRAAKERVFEILPTLTQIFSGADDPTFEVFYLDEPSATICSMTEEPREVAV